MKRGYSLEEMEHSVADVLIICSTYNQEKYIGDALRGFISQKTDFPFQVLVHDDASTDATPQIIRDFESKYPEIIKGVYEEQNQYSLGNFHWYNEYLERSAARYIALCEGDDYWVDPCKLQKQFDAMSKCSECNFCITNALLMDAGSGELIGKMMPRNKRDESILSRGPLLDPEDMMSLEFIPTATFFADRRTWLKEPKCPSGALSGDRAHQLYLASSGTSIYLEDCTAVAWVNAQGSAMASWNVDRSARIASIEKYVKLYDHFNRYTDDKFADVVRSFRDDKVLSLMYAQGSKRLLPFDRAWAAASRRGSRYCLLLILLHIAPGLVTRLWERQVG